MASSTSSITAPTFTGSSSYSSSFQQVLTRAVQMASLPMQQLQANVNDLTNQQSALSQLETTFQSLDAALQGIGMAAGGSNSASVSDSSAISATTTSATLPGTYSIQVDGLGSYTTAMSQAGSPAVTDPTTQNISSASSFTLDVNGTDTTITPTGTSLEDLAQAINSSTANVQATIVNLGSNTSPDYRLVVTSNSLAADTIQLEDGSTDLLSTLSTGSPATYKINGSSTDVSSNSRQVTLSPGLTVTLLNTTSTPDTVTVSTDYTGLQSALSDFAAAYNSAFDALTAHRGQNGGALTGQNIVYTLTQTLQNISQYASGGGAVTSLSDIGLSLDQNGHLSFDSTTFDSQNSAAITQFLGSASTGGFMQMATNAMISADDLNSGAIETEYNTLQTQITNQNQQIQDDQARVTTLQTNLTAELSQADAAIATLESQKTYYTDLFQAEYNNNGNNG